MAANGRKAYYWTGEIKSNGNGGLKRVFSCNGCEKVCIKDIDISADVPQECEKGYPPRYVEVST